MEGRHVHPSTLYPGGVGTTATIQLFTDYYTRLMRYVEFMKRVVPLHDDLFDFFYEALPGLRGGRPAPGAARLLGRLPGPRRLQLPVQGHDPMGPGDGRHAGRRGRRQARHQRPRRHQPRHPDPARQLVLRQLGRPGDVRHQGPARATRSTATTPGTSTPSRSRRSATSTTSTAGSCRPAGSTARTTSPSTPAAARIARLWSTALSGLVDLGGYVKATGHSVRDQPAEDGAEARGHLRVEDPAVVERHRARPGPHLLPGLRRRLPRCTSSRRRWPRCAPGDTKTWEPFEVPDEGIGCGFTEAVRGVLSHHMVIRGGKIANYHPYPPTPWNANPRDIYGTPGPVRGRGA